VDNNIECFYLKNMGWPYNTLLRFNVFASIQDKLTMYDYVYFFNANSLLLRDVNENVIPLPTYEKPYIFFRHSWSYDDEYGLTFEVERNPSSSAYIPMGVKCHDFGGGFFGGSSKYFIEMTNIIRDNIMSDLRQGYICKWHDQMHLQKFAVSIPYMEVPRYTVMSEEYAENHNPAIIFRNKDKYGGNAKLRGAPFLMIIKEKTIKFLIKIPIVNYLRRKRKNKKS